MTAKSTTPAQTVELSVDMFYSIASLTAAALKPNSLSPVLEAIRIRVEDGIVTALATDRHRVARVTFPALDTDSHNQTASWNMEPVSIHRTLLEKFNKALKASKPDPATRIIISVNPAAEDNDAPTVTITELFSRFTMGDEATLGHLPPIERLLPGAEKELEFSEQGDWTVNLAHVSDAAKIQHPAISIKQTPTMRFRFIRSVVTDKPAPVLIDRVIPNGQGTFDYLISQSQY